ncbi:hypothetical protein [Alkalinema sp. FACHB-956]|uniref:hypothetical protein n=1 Tax=Alkalinema sp. FACHB-956 TaxID=2692768 RepID=UPI0016889161|nr:hypothetical protein [Alkalinema sp. FACHB-956]MBD2327000.1 hypothetical protein [Alkalinema sp. FACHB-956]
MISITDWAQNKTRMVYDTSYDDRGYVTREIDAEGTIADRIYEKNNWVKSETVISDRSAFLRRRS